MSIAIATPLGQIELTPSSAIRLAGVIWKRYVAQLQERGGDREPI